jgi:quercetin dioxygenase-like cupin family protein
MLGGLYEVKAASAETGGALTAMEMTMPAGMGPPPHTHPGTESVYILEGTLRYHIGDETVEAGPGSFFDISEGVLENFEPTSDVRVLVIYTPGGIDEFFAEAGEPAARREVPAGGPRSRPTSSVSWPSRRSTGWR